MLFERKRPDQVEAAFGGNGFLFGHEVVANGNLKARGAPSFLQGEFTVVCTDTTGTTVATIHGVCVGSHDRGNGLTVLWAVGLFAIKAPLEQPVERWLVWAEIEVRRFRSFRYRLLRISGSPEPESEGM